MRYVLIPRSDDISAAFPAGPLQPQERAARLESVLEARRSTPPPRPLPEGMRIVAEPTYETPITGVTVVEAADDDEAGLDAIAEAFPGHERVEDFTLDLIAPEEGEVLAAASGADLAEPDLWHLDAIGLLDARRRGFALTGEGVTVGVLDTGVADVPELAGRLAGNRVFAADTWQYVEAPPADTAHHGTHVAGLIAGSRVGVAPGARILSVTMMPGATTTLSHWVMALEFAQTRPEIRILNCSAGRAGQVPQMRYMMKIARRLDVLAVIAIGNEGEATSRSPGNYPEVISVGAIDARGAVWDGSGGGTVAWDDVRHTVPTLVAPGVDVCSCDADGSYRLMTGTSMAAPMVAGLAALILGRHPDLTVDQLREELLAACVSLNLDPARQGAGAVRLPASLLGP